MLAVDVAVELVVRERPQVAEEIDDEGTGWAVIGDRAVVVPSWRRAPARCAAVRARHAARARTERGRARPLDIHAGVAATDVLIDRRAIFATVDGTTRRCGRVGTAGVVGFLGFVGRQFGPIEEPDAPALEWLGDM